MISVEGLRISFGVGFKRTDVVRGIAFEISPGERFGLVGESGCGKTTVLRAIAGLIPHQAGTIRVDGQPLGNLRSRAARRVMQMVFQDPYGSLNPTQTVDSVLSEPLSIHGMDNRQARILRALDEVGLGAMHRFRFPHQLSGGQRQRVAIARALIAEPKILLLDEPTSALDLSVQAEILNLLRRLGRERQLTMMLVSHDLAVIAHMCERIAVMQHGRIVEVMGVEQLRARQPAHAYSKALIDATPGLE